MPDLTALTAADLRALPREDIQANIADLKKEQFNLRFQQATGQLEKTSRIQLVRRAIARHLTVERSLLTPNDGGEGQRRSKLPRSKRKAKPAPRDDTRRGSSGTDASADRFGQLSINHLETGFAARSPSFVSASGFRLVPGVRRQVEADLAGTLQNARTALATTNPARRRLDAADELHVALARVMDKTIAADDCVLEELERLSPDLVDFILDDDPAVGRAAALVFALLMFGPDRELESATPSADAWSAGVNAKVNNALRALVRDHPIRLLTECTVEHAARKRGALDVELIVRVLDHFGFKVGDEYVEVEKPEWLTEHAALRVDAEIESDEPAHHPTVDVEPIRVNGELAAVSVRVQTDAPQSAELVLRPSLSGHRLATRRYALHDLLELAQPRARHA